MSARTKILIYLAAWKRPEITELCFKGIERLKKHPDFDFEVLVVISEEEMITLCVKYGYTYCMYENLPLGKKKNYGLSIAKMMQWDYLLEIGSDDLILNELLDDYKEMISKGDEFFGIADSAYINSRTGECRRVKDKSTYGAGRMIKREAFSKVKWAPWTDRFNQGLDNNSIFNFQRAGVKYKRVAPREYPLVIDVKSDENIWKFNYFTGVDYDLEKLLPKLSEEERVSLLDLIYAEV